MPTRLPGLAVLSRGLQHSVNDGRHLLPSFGFLAKLFAAAFGQGIVLGFAIIFGNAPLGLNPPALLQPEKGRVKRPLIEVEHILRDLLNALCNSVTVHGAEGVEGFEHHQIEGPLQYFRMGLHADVWERPT